MATQPAGAGLGLVGGFRYRLLDRGVRRSVGIDYHWQGDLSAKRDELIALFDRRLLPDVRRRLAMGSLYTFRGLERLTIPVEVRARCPRSVQRAVDALVVGRAEAWFNAAATR